ncbi:hypothetical protein N7504_003822 [Penicillium tannophilum]|nr:hypothetical protein N7504_003822 [Penicillium tannophilum]
MPRSGPGARDSPSILHQAGLGGAVARFYQRTYAGDYIALGCLVAGWFMIPIFVNPFHRMFSLDNKAIQYPMAAHERVPLSKNLDTSPSANGILIAFLVWSIIFAGVIPLGIILAWSALSRPGVQQTQATVLGFLVSLVLGTFLTDIIKNVVGRPRPDLLARCKPARGTADNVLLTWTVCTEPNQALLFEGWRSFPSGHSSFSFSGLGYLTLFFCGQMRVFRPRSDLGRCLVAFTPLFCALLVALSRLSDYRHDVWDVTCGGLLADSISQESYGRPDDEEQGLSRPFMSRNDYGSEEYPLEDLESTR